jgi:hypothetical protein
MEQNGTFLTGHRMNNRLAAFCTAALLAAVPAAGQTAPAMPPAPGPHHRLDVRLDPAGIAWPRPTR